VTKYQHLQHAMPTYDWQTHCGDEPDFVLTRYRYADREGLGIAWSFWTGLSEVHQHEIHHISHQCPWQTCQTTEFALDDFEAEELEGAGSEKVIARLQRLIDWVRRQQD